MKVQEIIAVLPTMPKKDLVKIQDMIKLLVGNEEGDATNEENVVFQAMVEELRSVGVRQATTYESFRQTAAFKPWKKGIKEVDLFLNTKFGKYSFKKTDKHALCRLLFRTMLEEMRERGIPISLGSVAANVIRIPEMFERAFPGYLESGLAHLIPLAMKRKRNG